MTCNPSTSCMRSHCSIRRIWCISHVNLSSSSSPLRWMRPEIAVSFLNQVPTATGGWGPSPELHWVRSEPPSSCSYTKLPVARFTCRCTGMSAKHQGGRVSLLIFCFWWLQVISWIMERLICFRTVFDKTGHFYFCFPLCSDLSFCV